MEHRDDDQEFVRRAQAGDRQAFAALVDRYWNRVFRWLFRLTRHTHLAEDLTQEAFLKAWRALATFQPGARFRVWLFSIARHCLIDRQRSRRPMADAALTATVPTREPDPAEAAVHREGQALLAEACARLPVPFRAAFFLWSQEDLSFAEIAEALEITEATARWRVFKARLILYKALSPYLDKTP